MEEENKSFYASASEDQPMAVPLSLFIQRQLVIAAEAAGKLHSGFPTSRTAPIPSKYPSTVRVKAEQSAKPYRNEGKVIDLSWLQEESTVAKPEKSEERQKKTKKKHQRRPSTSSKAPLPSNNPKTSVMETPARPSTLTPGTSLSDWEDRCSGGAWITVQPKRVARTS